VHQAVKSVDILDPTGEVSRFEEKVRREEAKVRREEAKVRGAAELASSSLDAQFESLGIVGARRFEGGRSRVACSGGARPAPVGHISIKRAIREAGRQAGRLLGTLTYPDRGGNCPQ
jgi:phage shock protein A